MASSSGTNKDHNTVEEGTKKAAADREDEEWRDWLELGLGLGSSRRQRKVLHGSATASASASSLSPCSSFSSHLSRQTPQQATGGCQGVIEQGVAHQRAIYQNLSWQQDGNLGHHHEVPFPIQSSPSQFLHSAPPSLPYWALQIESSSLIGPNRLLVPIPSDSHHHNTQRPQSGLWFTLRSSISREGVLLPQIPKAYIRVKDENVTVFMVKTYLVRKLGLSNEAEIDISCMGKRLQHSDTLRHVRDFIWLPKLVESVNSKPNLRLSSNELSINHLMSLDYGRSCSLNKNS